jgi:RNA polymerase sigma factor (sigma-70 family)
MATSQMSEILQHLRRAVLLREGAGLTDGQLLKDYLGCRDQAALAALVHRHGPMVWGVCRRVLRNYHDAEDAFQASFLVFVRKAASIASPELLANWLYGVAHQTALNARATTAKWRARERQLTEMPEPAVTERDLWGDLQPLLDQELRCLPEKYRVAIVLCDLEGMTRKEAARQLGVPEGTLAARLARGRVMLAKRLTRHGLAVSGGALALLLAENLAAAGVPTSVVSSTIRATSLLAAGQAAATGAISAKVAALAQGVLQTMRLTKLKATLAVLLAVSLLAAGMGLLAQQTPARAHAAAPRQEVPKRNRGAANGATKTSLEKRERQADAMGRILFAYFPSALANPRGLASMGMRQKKQELLFKALEPQAGFEDGFRLSPDRKKVAYRVYQSNATGSKYAIHVRSVDPAGGPVDMEVDGQEVCWSPDCKQIAVSRGQSGNVIVDVKTKKQTAIKLPKNHWVTDWSPDGKWFLIQFATEEGQWQLGQMRKGATEIRKLAGTEGGVWGGRISPDGKSVLFDRPAGTKASQLWVVSLENGKTRQVTQEQNGVIRGYSWSPSGKRIAYTWVRFDPLSEQDSSEQETEAFLMVNDLDGRHPIVLLSERTGGTRAVHFTFWDWR